MITDPAISRPRRPRAVLAGLLTALGALPLVELAAFDAKAVVRLPAFLLLGLLSWTLLRRGTRLGTAVRLTASAFLAALALGSTRTVVTAVFLLAASLMLVAGLLDRPGQPR